MVQIGSNSLMKGGIFQNIHIEAAKEIKSKTITALSTPVEEWDILSKFSCWTQLVRITAFILGFINNTRPTLKWGKVNYIPKNLQRTSNRTKKLVQGYHFTKELIFHKLWEYCTLHLERLTQFLYAEWLNSSRMVVEEISSQLWF